MRLLPGLMMNPGIRAAGPRSKSCYFNGLVSLQLAKQQQDEQYDQNDAAKAHSGVPHAVAIAAEPAAEAAEQEDDQDNDEYHSKRHGTLPKQAAGERKSAAPPREPKHIPAFGSMSGTRRRGFRWPEHACGTRLTRNREKTPRDQEWPTGLSGSEGLQVQSSLGLLWLQFERCRIDAVAQSGRTGSVLEDMPEMAVALRAQHFGSGHAVADVTLLVDMALRRRLGKARPAAAGIELGVGFEQRLSAAGADVGAGPPLMLIFAGERPLGRLLAQHRILHRRQFLAPLDLALFDLAWHRPGVGHGASFRKNENT